MPGFFGWRWFNNWPWQTRRLFPTGSESNLQADLYGGGVDWLPPAPIDRDMPVSPFYWHKGGVEIVPPAARERFMRLNMYRMLYEGDVSYLGMPPRESVVYVNYFARFSNLVKFLLMSFPPDYGDTLNEDVLTPGAINKALAEVVIDLTRYGTALFWAQPGMVKAADVRFWFPSAIMDDSTYIGVERLESSGSTIEQGTTATVWWQRTEMGLPVHSMIPFVSADGQNVSGQHLPDDFELLTQTGQVLFPVALSPIEGGFGPSVYQDMLPIVAELTRRQSHISGILDRHADPILAARLRDTDNVRIPRADDRPAREQLRQVEFGTSTGRTISAYVLPPWADSAEYLVWDGSLTAAYEQLDRMLTGLAALTTVPESLYGILAGGGQPSGTSLKRQHVGAYIYLETLQKLLIPVLTDVIREAGAGEVVIRWLNPLDQVGEDGEDMPTDMSIRTGANLSEGEDAEGDDEPADMPAMAGME